MIQTIFDENCLSNSNGIITTSLQFQTYEVLGETTGVWDEQPFGGAFGPGRGPWSSAPYEPPSGNEGPERDENSPPVQSAPEEEQPKPMQGMGPGGGGGGEWGQQQRREESDGFRITPILETQLNYTIAQDGRLLDMEGLDLIGDFYDPQNQISVRQIFQSYPTALMHIPKAAVVFPLP